MISGSNHGFKDRNTVRQPNPSKFYRCGTMQVQIWISTYVFLKAISFIRFFFKFPVTSHTSGVEESSKESREPRQEPAENTSVHVPRRSMSANVLRAVMTIPPPRFSRATLSSVPPLGRHGESDYAQRLERWSCKTQERRRGKTTFICQNLCSVRRITNRPEDQNVPVMGFLISPGQLLLCGAVPEPLRSRLSNAF